MGIDTQLIEDGTSFVVETPDGEVAGCGGWSRRGTMYTNPAYARCGVGRLVLELCESAAAAEGFTRLELVGTLAGEPLYAAYGFVPLERLDASVTDVPLPCVRMAKPIRG